MTDKGKAITIHKANVLHSAAIAQLMQQLAAHEDETTICDEAAIARLLESDRAPDVQCYVALLEDEVVGCAMGYAGYDLSSDSYGFHLSDIVVNQSHRMQGVGKQLLAHIADEMMQQSGVWISLTVLESNELAQGFYDALQFETVDVRFVAAGKTILQSLS